jgi:hypothetical protein
MSPYNHDRAIGCRIGYNMVIRAVGYVEKYEQIPPRASQPLRDALKVIYGNLCIITTADGGRCFASYKLTAWGARGGSGGDREERNSRSGTADIWELWQSCRSGEASTDSLGRSVEDGSLP